MAHGDKYDTPAQQKEYHYLESFEFSGTSADFAEGSSGLLATPETLEGRRFAIWGWEALMLADNNIPLKYQCLSIKTDGTSHAHLYCSPEAQGAVMLPQPILLPEDMDIYWTSIRQNMSVGDEVRIIVYFTVANFH